MPANHQWVTGWSRERFLKWGGEIGVHTRALLEGVLLKRTPVEQGYRTCLGILQLAKGYDKQRLEDACHRALVFQGTSYRQVKSILEKGLDRQSLETEPEEVEEAHAHVRGSAYYSEEGDPC